MSEPRPAHALFWTCVGFSLIAGAGGFATAGDAITPTVLALSIATSACGLAALALAGATFRGCGIANALGLEKGHGGLGRVGLFAAGIVGASQLLDSATSALGWRADSVLAELDRTIGAAQGAEWLALALSLGIAASVAEELLFRGLLLRWCASRFGTAAGVAMSSMSFGLLHLDVAQGAAAVVLGALLAAVALATGSTRSAIVCHIANNLMAILGAALGSAAPLQRGGFCLSIAGICVGLGALTLYRALQERARRGGLQAGHGSADL